MNDEYYWRRRDPSLLMTPRKRRCWGYSNNWCVEWLWKPTDFHASPHQRLYYKTEDKADAGLERRWRKVYQQMYDRCLPQNWVTIKI